MQENKLRDAVENRQFEFFYLRQEKNPWASILKCNQTAELYKKYVRSNLGSHLRNNKSRRPLPLELMRFPQGFRHFILWSLYPRTKTVSKFLEDLNPVIAKFFDKIQQVTIHYLFLTI